MPRVFEDLNLEQRGIWMMDAIAADWYSEWAENAFPRVQMSHSFASMLMATRISPKEIGHVEAPWPAFCIEIPDKLLPIQAKNSFQTAITRVAVNAHFMPATTPTHWWTAWMQGHFIELHRAGPLHEFAEPDAPMDKVPLVRVHDPNRSEKLDVPIPEEDDAFWEHYDGDQEERVSLLVGRLIIGVCVLMTDRSNFTERTVNLHKKFGPSIERLSELPEDPRVYTLGRPIKIDFRQAVQGFIQGRSRGLVTSQQLVAGHHRRQAHGPGGSLRKWIFIQPYWKGPSDAPILVRSHHGK